MIVTRLKLRNWRNFESAEVPLRERVFLIGPNASGKSNLLDAFRFLRDIVKPGGGMQAAIAGRGGLSKIRCLAARQHPEVEVEIHLGDGVSRDPRWRYAIGIRQEVRGKRQPLLAFEKVWDGDRLILDRPDDDDREDELRLTQTSLEQINANSRFRAIAAFLTEVMYLHLVPQFLRHPEAFAAPTSNGDPFGRAFLERVARTPQKTRRARLKKIEAALRVAVPQFSGLSDAVDEKGVPHLEATYKHWRARGARQREEQFSDGTIRLIGLFWALLDGESLLLLEEPELSLNAEIVRRLPGLFSQVLQKKGRQVLVSTHSVDLLNDGGIAAEEVVLLEPEREGTAVRIAAGIPDLVEMIENGMPIGDAVLPRTVPRHLNQLSLPL